MSETTIFQPVVALIGWTWVMWVWLYATRLPALRRLDGFSFRSAVGRAPSLSDQVLPTEAQRVARNYNHLHEQPTVFYALAVVIAYFGHGHGVNTAIAWVYVGLRIIHSLVQATSDRIILRLPLFFAASLCLMSMTVHATFYAFDWHAKPIFAFN